jgi:hypothetical protein
VQYNAHPHTASIKVLEYRFAVCRGAVNRPYDNGAVAVIDGGKSSCCDLSNSSDKGR